MNSNLTASFSDSEFQETDVSPGASMRPVLSKKILLVEDEKAIRETIQEFLNRNGYKVSSAPNGLEAMDKLTGEEYDLVITDLAMPKMDGFGLMSQSLKIQPLTPTIILSGQGTFENALRAIQMGAYDFVTKPIIDFAAFKLRLDNGLERKSLLLMEKNYQHNLEKLVASQTQELIKKTDMLQDYAVRLEDTSVSFISALQMALEEKDKYTAGHSRRVTEFSVGIGEKLGLEESELWILSTAAKLHDLGKLMIDLSFMNKPDKLTPEEWEVMKKHPAMADRFLAPLPFLDEVRPIIRHHHERLDGSGYPDGVAGDEIDRLTQIIAVADSYDAMTSERSYRESLTQQAALDELKKCIGRFYSAETVKGLGDYFKSGHIVG